ncbi:unnamed protein product [Porites lobata]|uniref:Uncharacterized protein n=1 Tax=Porites lobata TaxID=104759 RepID=A0ABN8PN63_9CNID|nr:unnamed protein product [Porites lobata]
MSSIEDSLSETESSQFGSEDEKIEIEGTDGASNRFEDDSLEPYADEPLADEEWLENYRREQAENAELEKELTKRLNNSVRVADWCTCGKCERDLLTNISECYCCKELEGCVESLTSEIVLEDLEEGQELCCVTEHPGFSPVCLEKWSLRLAGGKYRTKAREYYKKTGSEERYLRSIAYREFTRLVHGYLGKRRIPLPACAYTAIRKAFPSKEDEPMTGFQLDEE